MEEEGKVESARRQLEKMEWPEGNSVVKGVTSISDAPSHEKQLRRIDGAGAISSTSLDSGELSIEFSDAPNSWSYR